MSTLTRRNIREHLIKLLYIRDFHEPEEINEQLDMYFQIFSPETEEDDRTYILGRYNDIISKLDVIDHIITEAMSGWTLTRVSKLELDILRIAVYEIRFDDEVPDKAAINEAVDLSKLYGSKDSSYGFVNGILAKVVQ